MLVAEWEIDWFVPASQQTPGPKDTGVNLLWYDPISSSRVPIASYTVTRDFHFIRSNRPPLRGRIPFTVFPVAAVTTDGGLITDGTTFEVKDYGLVGEVRRILRLDLPGRPVSDAIKEAWMDSEASRREGDTALLKEVLRSLPVPDTLPAFESLLMDELGYVWAQIYEWDPDVPRRWVVFDQEGAAQGAILAPPGLRVEWVGPSVILGIWKDELEVEYVHRHRLRREEDGSLVP